MRKIPPVFLAAALLCAPAHAAIELSLEENRAQRGNIGFVDMQRVFKIFPETIRAKENFKEVVRQAEEQINLRKAEILRLRMDLPKLRLEKGELAKLLREAEAAPPAPTAPPETPVISTLTSTVISPLPSTGTALNTLPGLSTSPFSAEKLPSAAEAPQKAEPALSAAPSPEIEKLRKAVNDRDEKLSRTEKRLTELKGLLSEHEASAERSLMDLESRRTELILGKIHTAIRSVAHGEGISVVIDKAGILYGHNAVDLTEKVLQRLKGLQ